MGDFGGSKYDEKRHGATCRNGWRRRKPSAGVRRVAAFPARYSDESGRFRSGASVSSKVWRCRKLYAALVALCVLFSGVTAYAVAPNDQGVLWGPTQLNNSGDDAYCVCANNNFDAALWVIDKWNTKIQLSNDMFAALSNADTGGRFYTLASLFHSYRETGTPNWPNAAQIEGYAAIFGLDAVWTGVVPDGLVAGARDDYLTILGGGSLGGGGDDVEVASVLDVTTVGGVLYTASSFNVSSWIYTLGSTKYYPAYAVDSGRYDTQAANVWHVGLGQTFRDALAGYLASPDYVGAVFSITHRSTSYGIQIHLLRDGDTVQYRTLTQTVNGAERDYICGFTVVYGSSDAAKRDLNMTKNAAQITWPDSLDGMASSFVFDGSYTTGTESGDTYDSPNYVVGYGVIGFNAGGGGGGGNHWPDDPVTDPDPPEVPNPDPPDNPDPDPWPDPPSDPVFDPDPPADPPAEPWTGVLEPTQYTDYTPWLRAILQALNDIGTALGTHCVHLQEAIAEGFYEFSVILEGMLNAQRRSLQGYLKSLLTSAVVDLCNQIDDSIYDLEQYMKSLAQWLAAQFDFSVSGGAWDDSTVVSWLKKIYWELQGRTKRNPSEPDVDNDLEWWQKLLQIITDKLGALVTDFVGDVGDFLNAVKNRFPFSVPWDIAAYLAYLGAAPQTPHFTFVIPAISGWWSEWEIEIDLTVFDSVAAVCRHMILILWAFCLILKTDWLGGVFDGAAHAVTGFFDRAVSRVAGS